MSTRKLPGIQTFSGWSLMNTWGGKLLWTHQMWCCITRKLKLNTPPLLWNTAASASLITGEEKRLHLAETTEGIWGWTELFKTNSTRTPVKHPGKKLPGHLPRKHQWSRQITHLNSTAHFSSAHLKKEREREKRVRCTFWFCPGSYKKLKTCV